MPLRPAHRRPARLRRAPGRRAGSQAPRPHAARRIHGGRSAGTLRRRGCGRRGRRVALGGRAPGPGRGRAHLRRPPARPPLRRRLRFLRHHPLPARRPGRRHSGYRSHRRRDLRRAGVVRRLARLHPLFARLRWPHRGRRGGVARPGRALPAQPGRPLLRARRVAALAVERGSGEATGRADPLGAARAPRHRPRGDRPAHRIGTGAHAAAWRGGRIGTHRRRFLPRRRGPRTGMEHRAERALRSACRRRPAGVSRVGLGARRGTVPARRRPNGRGRPLLPRDSGVLLPRYGRRRHRARDRLAAVGWRLHRAFLDRPRSRWRGARAGRAPAFRRGAADPVARARGHRDPPLPHRGRVPQLDRRTGMGGRARRRAAHPFTAR